MTIKTVIVIESLLLGGFYLYILKAAQHISTCIHYIMTHNESKTTNTSMKKTSQVEEARLRRKATRVWRTVTVRESQLDLLRKMENRDTGIRKVEEFLEDLRFEKVKGRGGGQSQHNKNKKQNENDKNKPPKKITKQKTKKLY